MDENRHTTKRAAAADGLDGKLAVKVARAAEMLDLSRSQTYALVAAGEIPSVRFGRSRRVPVEALLARLAGQRT